MKSQIEDLSNKQFGYLKALKYVRVPNLIKIHWECVCVCGNIHTVSAGNLKSGSVKSCGCLSNKMMSESSTRHGLSKSRIYHIWNGMLGRIINKNNKDYSNYGGRGITVQESWKNFENFYNDMKFGYSDNLSIDRIDNNKGYNRDNCRWATSHTQGNNRRTNIKIKGKSLSEISVSLGGNRHLVKQRLLKGWSIEKAISILSRPRSK